MKIKNLIPTFAIALVLLLSGCTIDDNSEIVLHPTVDSTDPVANAVGVPLNKVISMVFSETMTPTDINASSFVLMKGSSYVSGDLIYSSNTASFKPTNDLAPNTKYSATLTIASNNFIQANKVWSFTTGDAPDVIAPTIRSTSPANGDIAVVRNKVISVVFSEAMSSASINANSFMLKQGKNVVGGSISYTGTTASFTPTNALTANTVYSVTINTGVTDVAGNALTANTEFTFTTSGSATNLAAVGLGSAGNYVILAKTAINNNPISNITGDLGLSPAATSYITGLSLTDFTGYATSAQVTGKVFAADMVSPTSINLTTAVENMITAYNDAAGRPTPDFLELGTGSIGGKTLTSGLYKWTSTVTIPTDITISGTANDVWIFQISGDLTMSAATKITLTGGAKASNIFWQVAGEATFGATSHFEGIILSKTGITFQTGGTFNGRALAQTAVILDGNTVVQPN